MLPNTGITTTMVGNALGVSTHNVRELCVSPNINMWSRWKPVPFTKNSALVDLDLISALFGLTLTNIGASATYTYTKPSGGATYPYRIGDFRNYDHTAVTGIKYKDIPTSINIFPKALDLVIKFEDDPKLITIYDLKDGILSNVQVEILLYNNDSSLPGRTYRTNINKRDLSITIPGKELDYFGVGKLQLGFYGHDTILDATRYIFPQESLSRSINAVADAGILIGYVGNTNAVTFGITSSVTNIESDFVWWHTPYLDISSNPFYIGCTFESTGPTINLSNIKAVFEFTENGTVVKKYANLYNYSPGSHNLIDWQKTSSQDAGAGYPVYGVKAQDIPTMRNGSIAVNLRFYLGYEYKDGIDTKLVKINNSELKINARKL